MGRPDALLFAELISALHDESNALVANDAARLVDAESRREHLLRLLAPLSTMSEGREGSADDPQNLVIANGAAGL